MTLKSFERINSSVRTEYVVFTADDKYVETFYKDYLNKDGRISDECVRDYDKLEQYAEATVISVDQNRARNSLSISLTIK